MAERIAVVRRIPVESTQDLTRPGIEQQLVRVEAQALLRTKWALRAQAIDQTFSGLRQEAMEQTVLRAMQREPAQLALAAAVEHT